MSQQSEILHSLNFGYCSVDGLCFHVLIKIIVLYISAMSDYSTSITSQRLRQLLENRSCLQFIETLNDLKIGLIIYAVTF